MSRKDRREAERDRKKLAKKVERLDSNTTELIEKLAAYKFDNYVKLFKELLSQATFQAMRENRIGEDRANKIMNRINEIMIESVEEGKGEELQNELHRCS